jgi:hypothetical protein
VQGRSAPPIEVIKRAFCADLVTLMLRKVGKPVPKNSIWPGGTRSFLLAYGQRMMPFRIGEMCRGDVTFWDYGHHGPKDEGHIGVALGDGPDARFLQSFAAMAAGEPRVNSDYTLRQSDAGGAYTHRLQREAIWG